jgi:Kdo2-lipid IVA lauroyltransferase/acyltransferase
MSVENSYFSIMSTNVRIRHYFGYLPLRIAEAIISFIPRPIALFVGGMAGSLLYHCGIYRSIVEKNFDYVGLFPDKKTIIKKLYGNIGRYGAEFLRDSTMPPKYAVHNFEAAQAAFDRGKGTCIILAHFGNWEMLATIFGARLPDLNVMVKPLRNPLTEKWVFSKREKARVKPIYFSHSVRKLVTVLKRNGLIAMLIDQYAGSQGTLVPFLGKPANTVKSPAWLVHTLDCSAIFAYALLEKDGSYRVEIEGCPVPVVSSSDPDEIISAYQNLHNDVLSRWIIEHPDHYFGWFHKRYKGVVKY